MYRRSALPIRARSFATAKLRLRQLAAGHPMRDYLIFMADVAAAQHRALQAPRVSPLPGEEQLGDAARAGVAPLTRPCFAVTRRMARRPSRHPGRPAAAPGTGWPARDTVLALQAASDAASWTARPTACWPA
jgi:FdhE protein